MRWIACGEAEVPAGTSWLTQREAQRAAAARFTKRRNEYLLRRFTGKRALSGALGLGHELADLARIGVLNAPTGAPFVELDGQRLGIEISLTDRAGWALALVGDDLGRVGVDLEIVEPRSSGFVRDFLTPTEQAAVGGQPNTDARDALANLIWSAKESALKVLRTGLRADTRTVEVRLGPGCDVGARNCLWNELVVAVAGGTDFPGWWRRDGVFLTTIVAAKPTPPPEVLPGSADLAAGVPIHSWLAHPLADSR